MKIRGANLGEKEGEYKLLSEHEFFDDERQDILKRLERLYFKFVEESQHIEINHFPQKEGKVIIKPGMINHTCSNSLESLESIAKYGVLASEWFGIIESEREGVFCGFIDRMHDENQDDEMRAKRAKTINTKKLKSITNNIILFYFLMEQIQS